MNSLFSLIPRGRLRRNAGFTLVEIVIAAAIFAMLGLVLVYVMRSNITSWKWGQKHMEFNLKIQLAMKQVFTDIKKINPIVVRDEADDYWFKGEKIGDLHPNIIEIRDLDNDLENGGEELFFIHTSYKNPDERMSVRLFLDEGALVREVTDANGTRRRTVIADRVANLHFQKSPEDNNQIQIAMEITDDRNPGLKENLAFAVHLDTDLVAVIQKSL